MNDMSEIQYDVNLFNRLKQYVEADAYCPCCSGITECDEECTYRDDCIAVNQAEYYDKMVRAREALNGE